MANKRYIIFTCKMNRHFVTVGVQVQCLPLWQNEQTLRHRWSPGSVFLSDKINRHFVTVGVQVHCLPLWQNEQTLRYRWSPSSMSSSLAKLTDTSSPLESRFNVFSSVVVFTTRWRSPQQRNTLQCTPSRGKKTLQISLKQTFLKMFVQM